MFNQIKLYKNERDMKDVEGYIKTATELKSMLVKKRNAIKSNKSKNPVIKISRWLRILHLNKKIKNQFIFIRNCNQAKKDLLTKREALVNTSLRRAYNS